MIPRLASNKIFLQYLSRKQPSYENIDAYLEQEKGLRLSQIEQRQLERLRQKQKRGTKISQQMKQIFVEFKSALSPEEKIETLQKLKNRIFKYDQEIFTGMNINKDAEREKIYEQITNIMKDERIPQKHKINVIKLTLFKVIQERDDAFPFVVDNLKEEGFLDEFIRGIKETISFLKDFFMHCIEKVKAFCKWVIQFINDWF